MVAVRHAFYASVWIAVLVVLIVCAKGMWAIGGLWLMAAGAFGTPALALRALGRYATARVCSLMATGFTGGAVVFSTLVLARQVQPVPSHLWTGLLLLLGPAVQCADAAFHLAAVERARSEHRAECALREHLSDRQDLAEALDLLEGLTPTQAASLVRALQALVAARADEELPLAPVMPLERANGRRGHVRHQ